MFVRRRRREGQASRDRRLAERRAGSGRAHASADLLRAGLLVLLPCAIAVSDDGFARDRELPRVASLHGYPRTPVRFHLPEPLVGARLAPPDGAPILTLMNFWTIATGPGWALLVTHPLNRPELPSLTLPGLIDSDGYDHGLIHFPALWRDAALRGVLPKGTPIAQCLPVRREHRGRG
jgi:hypothetical protein